MSALKTVLRDLKDAVLRGLAHVRDKLPQLADNLNDHVDTIRHGVRDLEAMRATPATPGPTASHRLGFNSDGSINPHDFRTARNTAYYWSGMWPRDGQGIARDIGDDLRPDAVWFAELQRLQANPAVTQVIRIHPDTLSESVIWPI